MYFKLQKDETQLKIESTLTKAKDTLSCESLLKTLFKDYFESEVIKVTPESLLLKKDNSKFNLFLAITDKHIVFSDSTSGITHCRIKYNKTYKIGKLSESMVSFLNQVGEKNNNKNILLDKIKSINEDFLSDKNLSIGMVLKSKDSIRFCVKKKDKTFMYFEVDNNFKITKDDENKNPAYTVVVDDSLKDEYLEVVKEVCLSLSQA